MSNISLCASEADLLQLTSTNYRISAVCALTSITATFLVSIVAIHLIHKKSIFQSSTRIILFFNIVYANIHQIAYAIEAVVMLYKGFFLEAEPCEWLQTEQDCVPYSNVLFTGISGMVFAQTGLLIERAFATFYRHYTTFVSRVTGVSVSIVVLICSASSYRLILWDDPLDGVVLSCFVPPGHSAHRANRFLFLCLILTLFNLLTSTSVMYYNKRLEYETRYKVRERFQKRETIDSTHTVCVLSVSQFFTLFVYTLGVLLLRCYRASMQQSTFTSLIVWVYTLPYSALLLPLILIFRIRATKAGRARKIFDITSAKQTQDEHIHQINQMWHRD